MYENEFDATDSKDYVVSPDVCSPTHSYDEPNVRSAIAQSFSKGVPVTR